MYTPNFCIQHSIHQINPIWLQYGCTDLVIALRIHLYFSWVSSLSFIAFIPMMLFVVFKMSIQSFTGLVSISKVHVLSEESTTLFAAHERIVCSFARFLSPFPLLTCALTTTTYAPVTICKTMMSLPRRFLLFCLEKWKPFCNSMLLCCRFIHFPSSIQMYAPSCSVIKYICQILWVLGMFGSIMMHHMDCFIRRIGRQVRWEAEASIPMFLLVRVV